MFVLSFQGKHIILCYFHIVLTMQQMLFVNFISNKIFKTFEITDQNSFIFKFVVLVYTLIWIQ